MRRPGAAEVAAPRARSVLQPCPQAQPRRPFTTIIGPNGSGKSNVMDSISFVLGVRTAQLRGSLKELLYHNTAGQSAEDRCGSLVSIAQPGLCCEDKPARNRSLGGGVRARAGRRAAWQEGDRVSPLARSVAFLRLICPLGHRALAGLAGAPSSWCLRRPTARRCTLSA